MRNNKNGLDEMQRDRRNSIGNQMFMILVYALILNGGLYSAGIQWLEYPANVLIITTVCMGIYLVRLIAFNSYLPPKAQNRKTVITLVLAIVFSIMFTSAAINLFGQSSAQARNDGNDNYAKILMIVSAIGLLAVLILTVINKVNNKDDKAHKDN